MVYLIFLAPARTRPNTLILAEETRPPEFINERGRVDTLGINPTPSSGDQPVITSKTTKTTILENMDKGKREKNLGYTPGRGKPNQIIGYDQKNGDIPSSVKPMMTTAVRHPDDYFEDPLYQGDRGGTTPPRARRPGPFTHGDPAEGSFRRGVRTTSDKSYLYQDFDYEFRTPDEAVSITPWTLPKSSRKHRMSEMKRYPSGPPTDKRDSLRPSRMPLTPARPNPPSRIVEETFDRRQVTPIPGLSRDIKKSTTITQTNSLDDGINPPTNDTTLPGRLVERRNSAYSYNGNEESFLKRIVNNDYKEAFDVNPGLEKYIGECRVQTANARDLKLKMLTEPFNGVMVDLPQQTSSKKLIF